MAWETGLQAMQRAIDEGKARQAAAVDGGGASLNYLTFKPGDKKIVRFVTDETLTADFYQSIICQDGKPRTFLVNPDTEDWVLKFGAKQRDFETGGTKTPEAKKLTVGIAVERKEIPRTGGGTEIIDHTFDLTVKDVAYQARWFGIVQQALSNFWDQLQGAVNRYGTLCDRDYEIERSGAKLETKYRITPLDAIDELRDPAVVKEFYGYGRAWNDEDNDRFLFCPQTIEQWADYYSGEERVRFWLLGKDGNGSVPAAAAAAASSDGLGEFAKETTHNPADEAQAVAPTGTDFNSLRERLMPHANDKTS